MSTRNTSAPRGLSAGMQVSCCLVIVVGLAVFYGGFHAMMWPKETMSAVGVAIRPADILAVVNAGLVALIVGGIAVLTNLLFLVTRR